MNVARQRSSGAWGRWLTAVGVSVVVVSTGCSNDRIDDLLDRRTATTINTLTTSNAASTVPATNVPVTLSPLRAAVIPLRINARLGVDEGTLVVDALDVCAAGIAVVDGYLVDDCVVAETNAGPLAALSLRGESDGRWKVVLLDRIAGGWASSYVANEPNIDDWLDVTFLVGDLEEPANGGAELWVGYRNNDEARTLDVDLLDRRSPELAILGALHHLRVGAVVPTPGGLTVFSGDGPATDLPCCPSSLRTFNVTFNGVNWVAGAETAAFTADSPIPDSAL